LFCLLALVLPLSSVANMVSIIEPEIPNYIERYGERNQDGFPTKFYIGIMEYVSSTDELFVIFEARRVYIGLAHVSTYDPLFLSRDCSKWDLSKMQSNGVEELPKMKSYHGLGFDPVQTSNVVYDASSVIINEEKLILENAGQFFMKDNETYSWERKYGLSSACFGEECHLIGGAVYFEEGEFMYFGFGSYQPMIWDKTTGKNLFSSDFVRQARVCNFSIDCRFSPRNNFFVVRGIRSSAQPLSNSQGRMHEGDRFPYSAEWNLFPDVSIIAFNNQFDNPAAWTQIEKFYKDAAFTADDRYLITEWQGVPTLFNTNRLSEPVCQYKTPSFMTACTLSPDEQKVYIACEDHKVYVFETNIPSTATGWELY
jgi:hypothetical protein